MLFIPAVTGSLNTVMLHTASLVAQWQCVGFCHGVLNTDMRILWLTLDYGPNGFMDRYSADFTNTFRCLSQIPFPTSGDGEAEEGVIKMATDLFLDHCASLEDLKAANKPSMDTQLFALRHHSPFSELTMLLHLAQSNPSLFQMVSERRMVAMKLGWPKELLEADEEEVEAKQREDWVTSYRPEIISVWLGRLRAKGTSRHRRRRE